MILWLNLVLSLILTGIIWTIQLVHYPLFNNVGKAHFPAYLKKHQQLISYLVVPLMLAELLCAFLLLFYAPHISAGIRILSFALVLTIWLSTFLLSVPQHQKLLNGFNNDAYKKLVNTNWVRTIAWTIRSILLLWLMSI